MRFKVTIITELRNIHDVTVTADNEKVAKRTPQSFNPRSKFL